MGATMEKSLSSNITCHPQFQPWQETVRIIYELIDNYNKIRRERIFFQSRDGSKILPNKVLKKMILFYMVLQIPFIGDKYIKMNYVFSSTFNCFLIIYPIYFSDYAYYSTYVFVGKLVNVPLIIIYVNLQTRKYDNCHVITGKC